MSAKSPKFHEKQWNYWTLLSIGDVTQLSLPIVLRISTNEMGLPEWAGSLRFDAPVNTSIATFLAHIARSTVFALLLMVPVNPANAADPFFFIQLSDPQFGMFTKDKD